jgi:hypothetical protein
MRLQAGLTLIINGGSYLTSCNMIKQRNPVGGLV